MKSLSTLLLTLFTCCLTYAQRPFTGVDIGYQQGNNQYFEAGLNLSMKIKNGFVGELSFGIEDDVNANILGYKVGLMAYDALGVSTESPNAKPLPILAGISLLSYQISNQSVRVVRPEIGLRGIWRHGRGRTITKLSYGYNFVDDKFKDQLNEHLVRVSFNTNWKSFLDLFGLFVE